jgi:hypothetical protein
MKSNAPLVTLSAKQINSFRLNSVFIIFDRIFCVRVGRPSPGSSDDSLHSYWSNDQNTGRFSSRLIVDDRIVFSAFLLGGNLK